jgi:hypothetical protein
MTDAPPLLCDLCPEPAIAVSPGTEPEMLMGFPLQAGEPRRQFCIRHWPNRPLEQAA